MQDGWGRWEGCGLVSEKVERWRGREEPRDGGWWAIGEWLVGLWERALIGVMVEKNRERERGEKRS